MTIKITNLVTQTIGAIIDLAVMVKKILIVEIYSAKPKTIRECFNCRKKNIILETTIYQKKSLKNY